MSLAGFDAGKPESNIDVSEKMIRKLRAGMMPPAGARRPDARDARALATSLETQIDTRRRQPESRPASVPAPEPRRVRRAR